MASTEPISKEARELREKIAKLTNRVPVSSDVKYLASRLADLQSRKRDGVDVRAKRNATQVLTISMPEACKDSVLAIADAERIGVSALVRKAMSEYAKRHSHPFEEE